MASDRPELLRLPPGARAPRLGVGRHLLPDERPLFATRRHVIVTVEPLLGLLFGVALTAALSAWASDPPGLWWVGGVVAAAGAVWTAGQLFGLFTSEFAVTTRRLLFTTRLLGLEPRALLLSEVVSARVRQTFCGARLDYGDVTVTATDGVEQTFRRIRDPIGLRKHLEQASLAARSDQPPEDVPPVADGAVPGVAPQYVAVVRRGETALFEALRESFEGQGLAQVMWDRRVAERRVGRGTALPERRRRDRRDRPGRTWTMLGFVFARRKGPEAS